MFAALLVIATAIGPAIAYDAHVYGIDVSSPVSQSSAECLVQANLTFGCVRAWHSYGAPDTNAPATVANLWAGGMSNVDVYMFPCPKCGDGAGQVQKLHDFLTSKNVRYGTLWFDIEQGSTYWTTTSANVQFFEDMVNKGASLGVSMGVYANWNSWPSIMGSLSSYSYLPIWYPHYDGVPDFSDFQPFGGWSSPSIKQFSDAGSKCGASYDINWYPPS